MIEILEMKDGEIRDVIERVGYGHFACSRDNQPYVVPINYAYDGSDIYIYTTAGLKSEIIKGNPLVCLQIEETGEGDRWRSVVIMGKAFEISDRVCREKAVELIRSSNPSLMPALALKWKNDWIRKNVEVLFKIHITSMTGIMSSDVAIAAVGARPSTAIAA